MTGGGKKIEVSKLDDSSLHLIAQGAVLNWKKGQIPQFFAESKAEMQLLLWNVGKIVQEFKKVNPMYKDFPLEEMKIKIKGMTESDNAKVKYDFLIYQGLRSADRTLTQKMTFQTPSNDFSLLDKANTAIFDGRKPELKKLAESQNDDLLLSELKRLKAYSIRTNKSSDALNAVIESSPLKDQLKKYKEGTVYRNDIKRDKLDIDIQALESKKLKPH